MTDVASAPPALELEFCGGWTRIEPPGPFTIGREGDLEIDENPYLHRTFLSIRWDRFWWLENVGASLAATVSDGGGLMHSWFAPGATLPLVFGVTEVRFTAGPTSYELALHLDGAALSAAGNVLSGAGLTTLQPATLTTNQTQVVLALAEQILLSPGNRHTIPSSAAAAQRLGWKLTRFNRQLDAVCQKLDRAGVRGLLGSTDQLASDRRARLVEYALAVRLVSADDLPLLDAASEDG